MVQRRLASIVLASLVWGCASRTPVSLQHAGISEAGGARPFRHIEDRDRVRADPYPCEPFELPLQSPPPLPSIDGRPWAQGSEALVYFSLAGACARTGNCEGGGFTRHCECIEWGRYTVEVRSSDTEVIRLAPRGGTPPWPESTPLLANGEVLSLEFEGPVTVWAELTAELVGEGEADVVLTVNGADEMRFPFTVRAISELGVRTLVHPAVDMEFSRYHLDAVFSAEPSIAVVAGGRPQMLVAPLRDGQVLCGRLPLHVDTPPDVAVLAEPLYGADVVLTRSVLRIDIGPADRAQTLRFEAGSTSVDLEIVPVRATDLTSLQVTQRELEGYATGYRLRFYEVDLLAGDALVLGASFELPETEWRTPVSAGLDPRDTRFRMECYWAPTQPYDITLDVVEAPELTTTFSCSTG